MKRKRLEKPIKIETVMATNDMIKNMSQADLNRLMNSLVGMPVRDKEENVVGHVISATLRSNIDSCEILGTIVLSDTADLGDILVGVYNDYQSSISCTKSNP